MRSYSADAGGQPGVNEGVPAEEEVQPPTLTEEMTVTSRKREETVQEVPFSVAAPLVAFDGEATRLTS
jgi:hypothetical protein